ncbi:uncharacterized protein LOC143448873 [Clavelina lepadiformis]|uniref:uncharacterized protein LOC143448873 n=1 Tax=Clavelina lepadiformis TaxID=159417 RepID=UPI004042E6FE
MTLRPRKKSVGLEKESVPVIVIPPPPPLVVDEQKLKDIFQFTVQATSLLKVEQLERLYSNLARRIHRHRHSYDKTQMTQELYAEVKTFLKRVLHVGRSKPSARQRRFLVPFLVVFLLLQMILATNKAYLMQTCVRLQPPMFRVDWLYFVKCLQLFIH